MKGGEGQDPTLDSCAAAPLSRGAPAPPVAVAQRILLPEREVIALVAPEGAVPAELAR